MGLWVFKKFVQQMLQKKVCSHYTCKTGGNFVWLVLEKKTSLRKKSHTPPRVSNGPPLNKSRKKKRYPVAVRCPLQLLFTYHKITTNGIWKAADWAKLMILRNHVGNVVMVSVIMPYIWSYRRNGPHPRDGGTLQQTNIHTIHVARVLIFHH